MEREGHEYIPMWQLKKSGSVVTWSNTLSYYYLFIGTNRYTIKMHCIPLASNRESHLLIKFCSVLIFTLL